MHTLDATHTLFSSAPAANLEWSSVFKAHYMWLHGIYSVAALVTPFHIRVSRDPVKCQAVALKEAWREGKGESEREIEARRGRKGERQSER